MEKVGNFLKVVSDRNEFWINADQIVSMRQTGGRTSLVMKGHSYTVDDTVENILKALIPPAPPIVMPVEPGEVIQIS